MGILWTQYVPSDLKRLMVIHWPCFIFLSVLYERLSAGCSSVFPGMGFSPKFEAFKLLIGNVSSDLGNFGPWIEISKETNLWKWRIFECFSNFRTSLLATLLQLDLTLWLRVALIWNIKNLYIFLSTTGFQGLILWYQSYFVTFLYHFLHSLKKEKEKKKREKKISWYINLSWQRSSCSRAVDVVSC